MGIGPKRDPGRLAEQSTVSETMLGARVEQRLLAGESIVADCIHCDDPSPARLVQRLGESPVGAPGADIHTVTPGGGDARKSEDQPHAPALTHAIPLPVPPQRHDRAWLDQPQPRHGCADHVSDVARRQMGIVLFGHARVGMAEVCRDYL